MPKYTLLPPGLGYKRVHRAWYSPEEFLISGFKGLFILIGFIIVYLIIVSIPFWLWNVLILSVVFYVIVYM